jgi:hypothetical protein
MAGAAAAVAASEFFDFGFEACFFAGEVEARLFDSALGFSLSAFTFGLAGTFLVAGFGSTAATSAFAGDFVLIARTGFFAVASVTSVLFFSTI